jgi:hypothetical protein
VNQIQKTMQRPQRYKVFSCQFMIDNDWDAGDLKVSRQILPIVALNVDHAVELLQKQHGEYFAYHFRNVSATRDAKNLTVLAPHLEIVELHQVWALTPYVSSEIHTLVG